MSRPKLETTKDKIIQARMSGTEFEFYKKVAEKNHINISVLIRLALANYCKSLENK